MGGPEGVVGTIRTGETKYAGDRFRVSVKPFESAKKAVAGSPSDSEARHVVLAIRNGTGVKSATVIPGPGYLGLTQLTRPDAIAAAAHIGVGDVHDKRIIRSLGYNEHATAKVAQSILIKNSPHVDAVASLLEEQGTATGAQMRRAMDEIDRRKGKVSVVVEDLEKKQQRTEEVEPTNGIVVFDQKWINSGVKRKNLALAA